MDPEIKKEIAILRNDINKLRQDADVDFRIIHQQIYDLHKAFAKFASIQFSGHAQFLEPKIAPDSSDIKK